MSKPIIVVNSRAKEVKGTRFYASFLSHWVLT